MKFVEMTGKTLKEIIGPEEIDPRALHAAGVDDDTIVRINEQGDVEIRRPRSWDVVGGLLGNYAERVYRKTGLDWA